jgi:hypothetical protein
MKKILCSLIILIVIFVLSSCNLSKSDPDIMKVNDLVTKYDHMKTSGFNYTVIQMKHDDILNSETIEQRIEIIGDSFRSYTEIITKILKEFDSNQVETHQESVFISFYDIDRYGILKDDNQIEWSNLDKDEYLAFKLPLSSVRTDYFNTYEIKNEGNNKVLNGTINKDSIKFALSLTLGQIESMDLKIVFNPRGNQLISIELIIVQTMTTTQVKFIPYYDSTTVIIP